MKKFEDIWRIHYTTIFFISEVFKQIARFNNHLFIKAIYPKRGMFKYEIEKRKQQADSSSNQPRPKESSFHCCFPAINLYQQSVNQ